VDRQSEEIEGYDPVRRERFDARGHVDINGCSIDKRRTFIAVHIII